MTLTINAGTGVSGTQTTITRTADGYTELDVTVPAASTNFAIALTFDHADVVMLHLVSTADLTLETNDGTTPADTLPLKATEPVFWWDTSPQANPFTAAVTGLFATTVDEAVLTFRVLVDV